MCYAYKFTFLLIIFILTDKIKTPQKGCHQKTSVVLQVVTKPFHPISGIAFVLVGMCQTYEC